jgi:hypothetical protein
VSHLRESERDGYGAMVNLRVERDVCLVEVIVVPES